VEVAHKTHKKRSLLLITVIVLIVPAFFGVYVQYKFQLPTIVCKQQDDELVEHVAPVIFKVDDFTEKMKNGIVIHFLLFGEDTKNVS